MKIASAPSSTAAHTKTSTRPPALGEAGNSINIPSRVIPTLSDSKSRVKSKADQRDAETAKGTRVVSAPASQSSASTASVIRSASGPVAHRPRPSSSMGIRPLVAPIAEEEEGDNTGPAGERSIDVGWALRDSPTTTHDRVRHVPVEEPAGMEELRQQVGRMQLDMLRMGRAMKVTYHLKPLSSLRD